MILDILNKKITTIKKLEGKMLHLLDELEALELVVRKQMGFKKENETMVDDFLTNNERFNHQWFVS